MKSLRIVLISLVLLLSFTYGDFRQEMVANWNKGTLENARVFYSRENKKVYELAEEFYLYNLDEEVYDLESIYESLAILAVSFQKQLEVFCLDPYAKYNSAYGIIDKNKLCKVVYKRYGLIDSSSLNTTTQTTAVEIYQWLDYFNSLEIYEQVEYEEVRSYIVYLKRVAPANKLTGSEGLKHFNRTGEQ